VYLILIFGLLFSLLIYQRSKDTGACTSAAQTHFLAKTTTSDKRLCPAAIVNRLSCWICTVGDKVDAPVGHTCGCKKWERRRPFSLARIRASHGALSLFACDLRWKYIIFYGIPHVGPTVYLPPFAGFASSIYVHCSYSIVNLISSQPSDWDLMAQI
jgi:hypothetical protein